MSTAGTVTGVALAPGVSRNNRLYTPEVVAKAHARLAERLADPDGRPVVMRTHHDAGDDSTRIVARVNKVSLDENGALRFTADLTGTEHADTIRTLSSGDRPALGNVSIYGWWATEPRTVTHDGITVETADDLEIDAIDWTYSPGVAAAKAHTETSTTTATETSTRQWAVTETTEAPAVSFTESDERPVTQASRVLEAFEVGSTDGNVYVSAGNGPITVSVSGYCLDPALLDRILTAAADAVSGALKALDPDLDGDLELPGDMPGATDDNRMESSDTKEAAVAENAPAAATEATEAAPATVTETPAVTLSEASVTALATALAQALQPAQATETTETTSTETVTDPASTSTTTAEQLDPKAIAAQVKADLLKEMQDAGLFPQRKGFRTTETTEAANATELWERRGDIFGAALGIPVSEQ